METDFISEEYRPRRTVPGWLVGAVGVVAILVAAAAAFLYIDQNAVVAGPPEMVGQLALERRPPAPAPELVEEAPVPSPEVPPTVEPEPEPEPEVVAEAPKPAPAPVEPAPAPKPISITRLVDRGWAQVDGGNLSAAEATFSKALTRSPAHSWANYGYAYVLVEGGDTGAATTHLCRAQKSASGDVELKREVVSLLKRIGASCD